MSPPSGALTSTSKHRFVSCLWVFSFALAPLPRGAQEKGHYWPPLYWMQSVSRGHLDSARLWPVPRPVRGSAGPCGTTDAGPRASRCCSPCLDGLRRHSLPSPMGTEGLGPSLLRFPLDAQWETNHFQEINYASLRADWPSCAKERVVAATRALTAKPTLLYFWRSPPRAGTWPKLLRHVLPLAPSGNGGSQLPLPPTPPLLPLYPGHPPWLSSPCSQHPRPRPVPAPGPAPAPPAA